MKVNQRRMLPGWSWIPGQIGRKWEEEGCVGIWIANNSTAINRKYREITYEAGGDHRAYSTVKILRSIGMCARANSLRVHYEYLCKFGNASNWVPSIGYWQSSNSKYIPRQGRKGRMLRRIGYCAGMANGLLRI